MKCLTVCQPWAHAILHLGKDVENRNWYTAHRGPLLIHAGVNRRWLESEDPEEWPDLYGVALPRPEEMIFGAILGTVEVVDCRPVHQVRSRWAEGPWCWVLVNPRLLKKPIPYRGAQGLFDVPDEFVRDPIGWLMKGNN